MAITRALTALSVTLGSGLLLAAIGCGGGGGDIAKSNLMDDTAVGKNRCDPDKAEDYDRPFVVEWDATDLASFESHAQRDVVVVRYENCELEVLKGCKDGGIPAKYGTYENPKWTSGSVEGFEIKTEGELWAKLPLGGATLGGRVAQGQHLKLDYFVSGSVTSTRSELFSGELKENPNCAGATHYVWAYNLGAFAVMNAESNEQEAEASMAGIGGGAKRKSETKHLKQAGDIGACTKDTAKDLSACKAPIRLDLRPLTEGDKPADVAEADKDYKGVPSSNSDEQSPMEEAAALIKSAGTKMQKKDGNGCLEDLDRAVKIHERTANKVGNVRATCEMLAGRCADGKKRMRLFYEEHMQGVPPETIDKLIENDAKRHCPGGK